MNNSSYIAYLRNRLPIKLLNNMFRNYKKSSEQFKLPDQQKHCQMERKTKNKPQEFSSEVAKQQLEKTQVKKDQQENAASKISKKTCELPTKTFDLFSKSHELDFGIKEKLKNISTFGVRENTLWHKNELNKVYPWQNFNVDSFFKPKYKIIKPVNNVTKEMLNMNKKTILKKTDVFKPVRRKEVKFNTNATFMVFPKVNSSFSPSLNVQPRINLSTNCPNVLRRNPGDSTQKNGSRNKTKRSRTPVSKRKIRYFPKQQRRFLYYDKQPKFYS